MNNSINDYDRSDLLLTLCHSIESMWATNSTEESIGWASKSLKLFLENFDGFLEGESEANINMQSASSLSSKAFKVSGETAPHIITRKLKSQFNLSYGDALGLALPSVWRYMSEHIEECSDDRGQDHLWSIFEEINKNFSATDIDEAISKFYSILYRLKFDMIPQDEINSKDLDNNPLAIDDEGIETIYNDTINNSVENIRYENLREHQEASLKIYHWFEKICKENDLDYVLLGGSVLGAIRHKGFVPWDDDIDIGIRIDSLDKFKQLSLATMPEGFVYCNAERYDKYPRLFGKIIYKGQSCIDLFPVVKTSKNKFLSRMQYYSARTCYNLYLRKLNYGKRPHQMIRITKKLFWIFNRIVSLFIPRRSIVKIAERVMHRYEHKSDYKYMSILGRYGFRKEIIEKDWYEGPKQYLAFEDIKIPVLNNYPKYLNRIYGNINYLPDLENRKSDHELRIPEQLVKGYIPPYLRELQLMECEMFKEFIDICDKHNLKYFVVSGTALGAVRDKGFIPWDDDIDIGMGRPDYEKFLEVAQDELSPHLFLQTFNTEPGSPRLFAKIRNSNTTFIEVNAKKDTRNRGIYIDIFPWDGYPNNPVSGFLIHKKREYYECAMKYIYNNFSLRKTMVREGRLRKISARIVGWFAAHTNCRGLDMQHLLQKAEKAFRKYDYDKCDIICSYGGEYKKTETIPKKWLGEGIIMDFEDFKVPVPEDYDSFLKHFYGDYMKLPPENKRTAGHVREIVNLHKSYTYYQYYYQLEKEGRYTPKEDIK